MNNLPHLNEFSLLKSSSQPELVRRSPNSTISPLDFKLSPTSFLVNGQYQDYVIVDGKKFNVKRSPRVPSPKSPPARVSYNCEVGFKSEEKEKLAAENYVPLKRALDNANSLIARQSTQILRQVRQIEKLTQQLHSDQYKENTPERHVAFSDDSNSVDLTSTSISSSRTGSLTSSRRRAEAIESGQKLNVLTEMDIKRSRSLPCNSSISFRGSDKRNSDASDRSYNGLNFARSESGCVTPPNETLLPELPAETRGQEDTIDRSPSVLSDLSLSPPPMLRKPYSMETPLGSRSTSTSETTTPHQPSILRKPQSFDRPVKNVATSVHEDSALSPPVVRKQHSLERPLSGVSTPNSEEISLPLLRKHQSIERPLNSTSISSYEELSLSPPPMLRKHMSQERPLNTTSKPNYEEMSLSPPPMLRKPQSLERPICVAKAPLCSEFSTAHLPATARPPKGLAARLSMGAREKPKVSLSSTLKRRIPAGLTRTDSSLSEDGCGTARTVDSESSEVACKTECSFFWKSSNNSNVHFFIAHDNPQVGSTVANRMKNEGPMHVMIETKEKSGLICFILASIVYSGCIEAVEGADLERPRGSQFIVCSRMTAIKIDLATLPKRANGDILEIDLQFGIQQGHVDISSVLKVKEFLGSCIDRVNVILDPSHTQMWYPYFEGNRKMAPQFRSRGVGYIRLGDEFSNYGSAFISLDAGLTYLDNGATSIVADKDSDKSPAVLRTFPGALLQYSDIDNSSSPRSQKSGVGVGVGMGSTMSRSALRRSKSSEQSIDISDNDDPSTHGLSSSSSSMRIVEAFSLVKETDEVNQALQLLSDTDLKWSDRVEALRRLHSAVINVSNACSGPDGLINPGAMLSPDLLKLVTSALVLCITKQMNPHVLRSAVCCVRVVGAFAGSTHSCGVTWRALLLETVHLLRSSAKAVYEEAKDTLLGLQCGAAHAARWTVCVNQLNPLLGDIFAGPKKGGVACNTSKVLQWLESIVNNEIDSHIDSLIHKCSRTAGAKPCEKADIGAVFMKCSQHLVHREEVTREAAVSAVGALLVCDILQTSESNVTGWQELCELSGRVSKPAPKAASTLASRLSQAAKDDSSSQSQSAVEIMFISALTSASAAAVNTLAKDVRRMHDRVVAYSIKLLESKIKEAKASIEKDLAEKQACSEDACSDTAFGHGEGIAFRIKSPQSRQDVVIECVATIDMESDSRETDLEGVLTPVVELGDIDKLTSDWFAFKKLVHEPPTAEDSWNELCQVCDFLWVHPS